MPQLLIPQEQRSWRRFPREGALPFAASDKAGAHLSYQGGEAMSVVRHYHQGRGATQPPPTGSSLRGRQDPESSVNTEA